MGRGKRTRNIRELRDAYDAAERRQTEEEEVEEGDEEEDEDADEEEEEGDEEGGGGDDDEEVVVKKPKKVKAVKVAKPKRSRASKTTRMKIVWGVFNNSHQRVAVYEYKQRQDADEHAARLTASKPNNTHFVQPVKEPMEPKEPKT
jgi:hypothetical protein